MKKRRERKERMVSEAGEAKTEGRVWELVKRERKRRKRVNEKIKMEKWKEYFMGLLGKVKGKVVKGWKGRGNELERVKRMKDGDKEREGNREERDIKCGSIEGRKWKDGRGRVWRGEDCWRYGRRY